MPLERRSAIMQATAEPPELRVVLDANVLYSETLTDVFVSLAAADMLAVVWSDRLHEEWLMALARNRPDVAAATLIARGRVLRAAQNWTYITVDTALAEPLLLPDRNDRHVLAAAIQSGASVIVTSNLRDFPKQTLASVGVTASPADAVVNRLMLVDRTRTLAALRPNAANDITDLLEKLRRAGLARTVKALRAALAL